MARLVVVVGLGSMGPILVIIGRRLFLIEGRQSCVCVEEIGGTCARWWLTID